MFELCESIHYIMKEFGKPWFIAGGWVLDLFLGRETRFHEDIEIGFFRKDQYELKAFFRDYKIEYISNHVKYVWKDETLELPIHELHANSKNIHLEFLINECEESNWIYRRDKTIKRSLSKSILKREK